MESGTYLLRLWCPVAGGPIVATLRDGEVWDITSRDAPLISDICAMPDPTAHVQGAKGRRIGRLEDLPPGYQVLAPCDLQAIKAAGVTFTRSMIERVIEERAAGDPAEAEAIRRRIAGAIGATITGIEPGSETASRAKQALIGERLWSQYLEVGLGPDAEVFTKAQPLSAVGHLMDIGVHPSSDWNNPEPEIVLAVSPDGKIVGATLGNDVNLRDVEGRSALLLSKAKDNNAACAVGPYLRLFDDGFDLARVMSQTLTLRISGTDGFTLEERCEMSEISRPPEALVRQAIDRNHQYPDGMMLFLGTPFSPTKDRFSEGSGFTHRAGDVVSISAPALGELRNTVRKSDECPPWTYGISAMMRDLGRRDLI